MGNICLSLKVCVHGVSGINQFLDLLKLVLNNHGFCFIEVMRIGTYAVRDITEEVKETPTAATIGNACVCRWVPPTKDDTDDKRLEKFHDVKRFVLHHHLIGHPSRHNDGEECGKCHTHLQYPPETSLRACESSVTKKLIGLEYHIIYLFFEDVDTKV